MADNKYNQSLLDKGYTQDQIDTMVNAVSSWQDAMEVVKDMNQYKWQDQWVKVWPQNANVNYYQYWDDSNPAQQWQKGWMNEKYTGEGVSNTYIDYNPNLKTSDLDPNYYYWEAARQQNRKEAGYIARRNDNIASALYNEGLTSKEDVANWLSQQREWMNSTEADRANTIESVWKRLGQIKPKEEEKPEVDTSNIEEDLLKDTSGVLYGKTTANEWQPVKTLADANSVYKKMAEWRIANYKALLNMSDESIAASLMSGIVPYGEQTMRDFQQYNPERYNNVMKIKKEKLAQENVQSIASGTGDYKTDADTTNTTGEKINYSLNATNNSANATSLMKSIDDIMASNNGATSAEETMDYLVSQMDQLKTRMKNLKSEANSVFKWDVPQYIVNAYIANRTQEIQDTLSNLETRYNAAYDRYKTELSQAQWQAEYDLKKQSLELDWYKATYAWSSTEYASTWWAASGYTVAERNNNPTNMTVGFMEWAWAELGVDYEISEDFFWSGWKQLHYAKLIWDPVETTIRILDKAVAAWKNPFNTTSWSYINKLWINTTKWKSMSQSEKAALINKWINYEGGKMENMAYYLGNWTASTGYYNPDYAPYYQKFLDASYTAMSRPENTAKMLWMSLAEFRNQALAYNAAKNAETAAFALNKWTTWTRKDGVVFDITDTPTYDSLTYDQRNLVLQLLNLNKNPSTITKRLYGDDFEKILSAVKEINPSWSDADYWQADKVKKEWNTSTKNGSNSRNWTAIATAMDIYNMAWTLDNTNWKDWNWMLNVLKSKLSDQQYTKLVLNLEVLASEYAWALKWSNAAPTEQEIKDKKEIIAANLGKWAMKQAAIEIAKTLYNKNANEAMNYAIVTLEKPPLIVTPKVANWMYYVCKITDLPKYYQYTPSGSNGWNAPSGWGNTPKTTSSGSSSSSSSSGGIWAAISSNDLKEWTKRMLRAKGIIK